MTSSCVSDKVCIDTKSYFQNPSNEKTLINEVSSHQKIDSLGKQLSSILGLDGHETKIYLNLLKIGPISASALAKELDVERTKMYRLVQKLINQNIISTTFSKPKLCIATEPEELLEMILQRKEDDMKKLKTTKEEVIKQINDIVPLQNAPRVPTFHIIQGSANIYSEIGKLIEGASNIVYVVTHLNDISKMYHTSMPEKINLCKKNGGEVRVLTEINDFGLLPFVERMGAKEARLTKLSSKGRIVVEKEKQMIMSDSSMGEKSQNSIIADFAFSTNSSEMVNNIYTLCTLLWKNSKSVKILARN